MRSTKTIFALLAVLLLFIAAQFAYKWVSNRTTESDTYSSWWQKLDPQTVSQIKISQNGQELILKKSSDTSWIVNDTYSTLSTINNWLPKLINPTSAEVIAESVAQYEKLGIASASAVMTLNDQKQITLGRPTIGGRYIKLQGNDAVYLIKDLPDNLDSVLLSDWIDKTIVKVDPNLITKISWAQGKKQNSLSKTDSSWSNDNPLLTSLKSLDTEGLISDTQAQELPKSPTFTLTVELDGQEKPVILNFYDAKSFKAITASTVNGTYLVSDSMYNSFVHK